MKKFLILFVLLSIAIQFTTAQTIITMAGNHVSGYGGDEGPATSAKLNYPAGIAIDASGNLYICDSYNNRIRKVSTLGIISTFAGTDTAGYTGDGGPATSAKLRFPTGIAVDATGNIYFAESGNNVIRKVNTSGIISTFAGTDTADYSGDGGPATSAKLNQPVGVAIDSIGNIYIADYLNNVVRKVNTSGIISTIAGNNIADYSGDGGLATSAELNLPFDITIDETGNIYFTELNNHIVRKVNTSGIISTIAGTGTAGYSGDGGPATSAQLNQPTGLAIDNIGNLFIAEGSSQDVRKINTLGIISTFAGNGIIGYSGDGGPATLAQFYAPQGIDLDAAGNLYIADCLNSVIREVGACMPETPAICMVTVDSLSKNNVIYWDNNAYTADTFFVYRDTSNNNYALIGKVSSDSLSMFIDTVRTLYSANGDPNASSWRYKIAYRDTCGGNNIMSSMSPYHQTLFMINSGAIFAWTQYQIEGQVQPVSQLQNYLFERDNYSTGNYDTIQTLSASSTFYMDAQCATFTNATWRVKTQWSISCTPTSIDYKNPNATGKTKKTSHSNSYRANPYSVNENFFENMVSVSPNPSNGKFEVKSEKSEVNGLEVYNVYGKKLYAEQFFYPKSIILNLELSDGIYFVRVISDKGTVIKKIVIAK
jgi:hypothetical protein